LAAAAVLALAGCSSSGSDGGDGGSNGGRLGGPSPAGGAPTTVSAALAATPGTSWDGAYVEFGAVSHVIALNGSTGSGPLLAYLGMGESPLAESGDQSADVLGFDPFKATAAVTVGQLPKQATVVYGSFDASAVGKKLAAAGFKQKGSAAGGTVWGLAADNQADVDNPTGNPQLNDLLVTASRIVLGPSTADVEALAATGGTTLASNAKLSALASCLGDAYAGVISPASPSIGSAPVGIGVTGDSGQDASEEVCVSAEDSATAKAIGAHWTQQITSGHSQQQDEPWSKLLVDPQASVVSSSPAVVRLTAKPAAGAHAGTLLEALYAPQTDFSNLISPSSP
jgi:hypothetical protein